MYQNVKQIGPDPEQFPKVEKYDISRLERMHVAIMVQVFFKWVSFNSWFLLVLRMSIRV